ncbi:MAG: ATP-binding protein, partial [Spirochaetota bacterium]|nr:ATP-binding protein [Spirochaetota bacterium]
VIKTEIDRMDEIVTQFLEFARPKELNKIKCNINRLLRETINFLEIELKNKNIMVKQNLYSTLPTTNCDNNLMKQVFINIILNAIDAIHCVGMDNGLLIIKTSVQIRKKRDGSATSFIKIAFEDNGTGIPTDMVNKLFDPFITSKEKGIGLGLSTSYRIIENHKGIIEAKNRVEGGARFIIYLPIE